MTQNYELANSPKIQNKKQWKSKESHILLRTLKIKKLHTEIFYFRQHK